MGKSWAYRASNSWNRTRQDATVGGGSVNGCNGIILGAKARGELQNLYSSVRFRPAPLNRTTSCCAARVHLGDPRQLARQHSRRRSTLPGFRILSETTDPAFRERSFR